MRILLLSISLALALAGSANFALAQDKAQATSPDPNVLANGVLTVPGARADVDTAPSKFSARNAAADRMPIAAYRLKHLTGDQRREIVQQLGTRPDAVYRTAGANADYAVIGAEVPAVVALNALTPVPEALAAKFPELRGAAFMRAAGKVLIVDLDNSLVIGVLES